MSIWGSGVDARAEQRKNAVFGTQRLSNWIALPFVVLDLTAMVLALNGAHAAHSGFAAATTFGTVSFFSGLAFAIVVIALIGNVSPRVAWTGMGFWLVWALVTTAAVSGVPALVIASGVVGPIGVVAAIAVPVRALLVRGPAR